MAVHHTRYNYYSRWTKTTSQPLFYWESSVREMVLTKEIFEWDGSATQQKSPVAQNGEPDITRSMARWWMGGGVLCRCNTKRWDRNATHRIVFGLLQINWTSGTQSFRTSLDEEEMEKERREILAVTERGLLITCKHQGFVEVVLKLTNIFFEDWTKYTTSERIVLFYPLILFI